MLAGYIRSLAGGTKRAQFLLGPMCPPGATGTQLPGEQRRPADDSSSQSFLRAQARGKIENMSPQFLGHRMPQGPLPGSRPAGVFLLFWASGW